LIGLTHNPKGHNARSPLKGIKGCGKGSSIKFLKLSLIIGSRVQYPYVRFIKSFPVKTKNGFCFLVMLVFGVEDLSAREI
jgi:hypothetical protein